MNDLTVTRAGSREWIGLAVLALPTLMVALDIGVLFLALPHLSADLRTSGAQQLWITDIYGFMLAGFLITMGTLGDRIGRRRLLVIGAAGFGAASVLAAFSTSPEMLIAARALLGIAGATLGPSTLALISNMFQRDSERGTAISLWATCQFAGAALGPVVGGLLLQHFWWGSVFLLGVPAMVILLVAAPVFLPEFRSGAVGRVDLSSVALSLAAILPVIFGVTQLAAGDVSDPVVAVVCIVGGAVFGVLFVRRQLRLDDPLLDLRLFRDRAFGTVLTAMMLGSAALAGTSLLSTQYVQSVVGLSPAQAGLWQAPTGLGIAAGVLLAPLLSRRLSPVLAIVGGLVVSVVGLLLLTQADSGGSLVLVVPGVTLAAFGIGPLFALGTDLVVGSVPPERAGSAAALSETSNEFGATLGLAFLGCVGAAVFRGELAGSAVPAGPARETIGAASAANLPADLFNTVRAAFTSGLGVVAVVGAVMITGVAVLVWANAARPSADLPAEQ